MVEIIEKERTEGEGRSMGRIGVNQIWTTNDEYYADFWRIYTESFPLNERRMPEQQILTFQKPLYQINTYFNEYKIQVILEIEIPVDELTKRRLKYYKLAGFIINPHQHYMPPYHENDPPVEMEILRFPTQISEELYLRFPRFQKEVVNG